MVCPVGFHVKQKKKRYVVFPTLSEWNALECVLRQNNYWQDPNEDSLTNLTELSHLL